MFKRLYKITELKKYKNYKDFLDKEYVMEILSNNNGCNHSRQIYYFAEKSKLKAMADIEYIPNYLNLDENDFVRVLTQFSHEIMDEKELKVIIKDLVVNANVKNMIKKGYIDLLSYNVNTYSSSKTYKDTWRYLKEYGGIEFF